jgi:hypothetical protein
LRMILLGIPMNYHVFGHDAQNPSEIRWFLEMILLPSIVPSSC